MENILLAAILMFTASLWFGQSKWAQRQWRVIKKKVKDWRKHG